MTIIDDAILENTELLTAHVEISPDLSNRFTVHPSVKVVNITDNDGMFVILNVACYKLLLTHGLCS